MLILSVNIIHGGNIEDPSNNFHNCQSYSLPQRCWCTRIEENKHQMGHKNCSCSCCWCCRLQNLALHGILLRRKYKYPHKAFPDNRSALNFHFDSYISSPYISFVDASAPAITTAASVIMATVAHVSMGNDVVFESIITRERLSTFADIISGITSHFLHLQVLFCSSIGVFVRFVLCCFIHAAAAAVRTSCSACLMSKCFMHPRKRRLIEGETPATYLD